MPKHNSATARDLQQFAAYPSDMTLMPLDGKRPVHRNWTKRRFARTKVLTDAAEGDRNVGVRLNDTDLVLDVDAKRRGWDGLACLAFDFDIDLGRYAAVKTGGGGLHIYMSKPADVLIRNALDADRYPGVEFKSVGSQVVAAGSIHPTTGHRYDFDLTKPSLVQKRPEAPLKLLRAIARPQRNSTADGGEYTPKQTGKMLATIKPEAFGTHDPWFQLMEACHHASNGEAREEFIAWSVSDKTFEHDAAKIGGRWDTLNANRDDGVTYLTLLKAVHDHGDPASIPPRAIGDDFDDSEAIKADLDNEDRDDFDPDAWFESNGGVSEIGKGVALLRGQGLKVNKQSVAEDSFQNALLAVHSSGLTPAWNVLKQNVEFRGALGWPEVYGRVLNDHLLRLVRVFLMGKYQGNAFEPRSIHLLEAIMTVAYGNRFNPVADYLDSLEWDGVPRVEKLFGRYFNCGDDAYTRAVSKAFMIGAVRRARHPGCKFDTMPVLKSPQGWNKSTAVRVLFGADFYSDAELGNLSNKDAAMKLRGIWVQEFAEIDSLNVAAVGILKAFVSRPVDRQRDPYSRIVEDVRRCSVFIATVNEGGYLKDATGARRFWPLDLKDRIDVAAIERDRDQIWAEAAALEAAGESNVLPEELWPDAARRQEAQTSVDPWAEVLAAYLDRRVDESGDDDGVMLPVNTVHTSELFTALKIEPVNQTRGLSQRIRTVMEARLGWRHRSSVKVHGRVSSGYVRVDPDRGIGAAA